MMSSDTRYYCVCLLSKYGLRQGEGGDHVLCNECTMYQEQQSLHPCKFKQECLSYDPWWPLTQIKCFQPESNVLMEIEFFRPQPTIEQKTLKKNSLGRGALNFQNFYLRLQVWERLNSTWKIHGTSPRTELPIALPGWHSCRGSSVLRWWQRLQGYIWDSRLADDSPSGVG